MKTKKRERLTALFLCMVMVATTILSNGSFVMAADTAEGAAEQTSEVAGTEDLGLGTMDTAADEEKNTPEQTPETTGEITEPESTVPVETPKENGTADETTGTEGAGETTEQPAPAAAEEPVVTEEPTVTAQTLYTFENDDMIVEVQLPEGTVLPEGTELQIRQITDHKITKNSTDVEKADKARFDDITELLKDVADDNGNPVDGFYAYHAELVKDKEVFVPEGEMNIKVSYKNAALPESFTGDSKLKAMNVKALNYTTVKDENDQDKTVVQDMKDHLTAFTFADNTIGSVQEIGFNGEKVTDFIVAWNGQDQTTEYTYSDGEVTVKAALSEVGILPRGVELKATKVEDKDELAKVEETLNSQTVEDDKELGGFLAYDIRFEKDGEEVEPTGQVSVSMEFAETVKPEEAEHAEEVSVVHLKEDGDEVQAEVLTDAKVDVNDAVEVEKAEFTTESFSTFVLSWKGDKYSGFEITCVTIKDGREIELGKSSDKEISEAKRVEEIAPKFSGYEFKEAKMDRTLIYGLKYEQQTWKALIKDKDIAKADKNDWTNKAYANKIKFYYTEIPADVKIIAHYMNADNTEVRKEENNWNESGDSTQIFKFSYDTKKEKYNNILVSNSEMEKNVTVKDNNGTISVEVREPLGEFTIDIYIKALMDDNFYINKSLGGPTGSENEWWVNFLLGGTSEVKESKPLDVVFIVDCSGSMNDNGSTRLQNLKKAVAGQDQTIVDTILDSNPLNRIAVVRYGSTTAQQGFSSDSRTVKSYVNGLTVKAEDGTGTQLGIKEATQLISGINDSRSSKKVAILLTDGIPGGSHGDWNNNTSAYATGRAAIEEANKLKKAGAEVYAVSYAMESGGAGLNGKVVLGTSSSGTSGWSYPTSSAKSYPYNITEGKETFFDLKANWGRIQEGYGSYNAYYIDNKDFAPAFLKKVASSGGSHYLVAGEENELGDKLASITEEITKANVATDVVITDEVCDTYFKYSGTLDVEFRRNPNENWQSLPHGDESSTGDYYRIIEESGDNEGGTIEFHLSYAVFSGTEVRFKVTANEGVYSGNNDGTPDLPTNDKAEVKYTDVNGNPGNGGKGYTSDSSKEEYTSSLNSPKVYIEPPTAQTTELNIQKVNKDGDGLQGAAFTLVNANNPFDVKNGNYGENGNISFVGLEVGEYILTEVKAPDGYEGAGSTWKVSVYKNESTKEIVTSVKTSEGVAVIPEEGIYKIINYKAKEIVDKNIDYHKSVSLSNWDNRLYNLELKATSLAEQTVVEKPDIDVMLVLDKSQSMLGERLDLLNESVNNFIKILKDQVSKESQIGIVAFDENGYDVTEGWQNTSTYEYKKLELTATSLRTNMFAALKIANGQYYIGNKYNPAHKQIIIAFTDGGNNAPDVETSNKNAINEAKAIRNKLNGQAEIYAIGLGTEFTYIPTARSFLTELADEGKAIFTTEPTYLRGLFEGLANEIVLSRSLNNVTVRDYLDYRFTFLKDDNTAVTNEEAQDGTVTINGGTIRLGEDENKNPVQYIEWTGQTVYYTGSSSDAGWSKIVTIQAKEEYIGGNDVPTNVADKSGVVVPELGLSDELFPFADKPCVNVKTDFDLENYETTIFWGDEIIGDESIRDEITEEKIVEAIFNKTKPEAYRLDMATVEYKKVTQTIYNVENFKFTWYSDSSLKNKLAGGLESLKDDALTPETDQNYYLVVSYDVGQPSEESNRNTSIKKENESPEVKWAGSENSDTGEYVQNGRQYSLENHPDFSAVKVLVTGDPYGVYTIHVVKGQLQITKKIDEQYTDISKINSEQSFVFRIDRSDTEDGEVKDTFYTVLRFDANDKDKKEVSDTITGLKKGYYTVTEETEWSKKYEEQASERKDNYDGNKNENQKLFIGKLLSKPSDKEPLYDFFGTAVNEVYQKYAKEHMATTKFTNKIDKSWNLLSDVAAAVNKFTKK